MIPLSIRKEMINGEEDTMSVCNQCELLGMARSTLYYTPSKASDKDLKMMEDLDRLYLEEPTWVTRRLHKEFRKKGFKVGRHYLIWLMQIMPLKTVYCRPRITVCDPAKYKFLHLKRNQAIARPNKVWPLDITYVPTSRGFMYLLDIMDLSSRNIVGRSLSNTMEAQWVVDTLKVAIGRYG